MDAERIAEPSELGRAGWRLDLSLGVAAVAPVVVLAILAPFGSVAERELARTLAVAWTACLLGFFAGVRRGLTFSEAGGGRAAEFASMLALFAVGVATAVTRGAIIGAFGCLLVAFLDVAAARRLEAPAYFRVFRPIQMSVCALALGVIALYSV